MPAPRNDKERSRIYEQAIVLFMERGYAKTTYRDIADACGTTKSMVQHYFPKKEQMAERFFREKLDGFMVRAQAMMPAGHTVFDLLTCVGLLHYDFLLNDSCAALFCADLLESRALTNKVILEELRWAAERVQDTTPSGVTMEAQFVVALGGAYDLMHKSLLCGEQLNASTVQLAAMLAFWLPMGVSVSEIYAALRSAQEITGIQ